MIVAFWKSQGKKPGGWPVSLASHGFTATSTRRIPVEEQDKRTEEQEDVEAHRTHHKPQASEDAPKDEGENEDFELHRTHHKPQASEDAPKDEGDDGDDFELHRRAHKAL
jgi:hypothetical protein